MTGLLICVKVLMEFVVGAGAAWLQIEAEKHSGKRPVSDPRRLASVMYAAFLLWAMGNSLCNLALEVMK